MNKCYKKKIFGFIFIYKILLDITYIYYINPVYEYMGFIYNFNLIKLLESYIATFLVTLCLPIDEFKPSTIALNILNIIMIIPIYSLYAFKNEYRVYMYAITLSYIITIYIVKLLPNITLKFNININKFLIDILILFGFIVYGSLIKFNGIPSFELLNFNNVYKVRGNVNYGYKIINYLVSWQATVTNIFFIIVLWIKKEKRKFVLLCSLQLLLYLITSHKTYIFYCLIIPFIIVTIKKGKFIISSIYGIILTIIFSLILFINKISIMPAALFINRTLFLPAQISFQYYEYFSQNEFVMLSHSIFSKIFPQSIYNIHPILIIGNQYYNNSWANTGYLGDAYMNFGIIGMLIFSILFGIILKIFDSLANTELKNLISRTFMIVIAISFSNGGLLTNLFYGGCLYYMLLLWLYNDKSIIIKQNIL